MSGLVNYRLERGEQRRAEERNSSFCRGDTLLLPPEHVCLFRLVVCGVRAGYATLCWPVRKAHIFPLRCYFILKTISFYQDRLGTNKHREGTQKEMMRFPLSAQCRDAILDIAWPLYLRAIGEAGPPAGKDQGPYAAVTAAPADAPPPGAEGAVGGGGGIAPASTPREPSMLLKRIISLLIIFSASTVAWFDPPFGAVRLPYLTPTRAP